MLIYRENQQQKIDSSNFAYSSLAVITLDLFGMHKTQISSGCEGLTGLLIPLSSILFLEGQLQAALDSVSAGGSSEQRNLAVLQTASAKVDSVLEIVLGKVGSSKMLASGFLGFDSCG